MKKRSIALILSVLLIAALLCGCGSKSSPQGSYASSYKEEAYVDAGEGYAAAYDGDYEYENGYYWADEAPAAAAEEAYASPVELSAGAGDISAAQTVETNPAKLIYTADLEMETLDFDAAVKAMDELTAYLGGYYESSSMSDSGSSRRAYYTVRVPAQYYRAFLDNAAGDLCHVLNRKEYTEDVSESYYDTAGRLETQETKLARLQALLLEAEDMYDIITIESAISETEEMIDRLSGRLRHYDALVSYSTVEVSLREVKVYEPEPDPTFGSRLGSAFTEGFRGFAEGLGNILIALAYSWLWLLLIAGVVALILWLTRKARAKKRAEREAKKAERKARQEAAVNAPAAYSTPAAPEEDKE